MADELTCPCQSCPSCDARTAFFNLYDEIVETGARADAFISGVTQGLAGIMAIDSVAGQETSNRDQFIEHFNQCFDTAMQASVEVDAEMATKQ